MGGPQEQKWPQICSNSKHKKVLIVSGSGGGGPNNRVTEIPGNGPSFGFNYPCFFLTCLCALVISCSLFCGWKVDDEDDMEDEEVDDSGEDWVESSPLDLKQGHQINTLCLNEGVRSHELDCTRNLFYKGQM